MEKILEQLQTEKVVVTRELYETFINDTVVIPPGSNLADWDFSFVSRKLYMVLHNYTATDPQKVIAESWDKCGLEAYRLLNKEYDPLSADLVYNLLERVLAIAKWSVKGIAEEHAAMREARTRIRKLEKGQQGSVDHKMVAGMLYANVLGQSTKTFLSGKPAESILIPGVGQVMTLPRDNFELMAKYVQELYKIEQKQRPTKMDLDAFAARAEEGEEDVQYSHEEWVNWTLYGEEAAEWLAEGEPARESLDAFQKGKGKGKGKGGKGGKGKGKGKGGKGGYATEWFERRTCNN